MLNSQSELTDERPGLLSAFQWLRYAAHISSSIWARYASNATPRPRLKHPTRSSHNKFQVFTSIKSHVSTTIESRVSTIIESCVSTTIESHVSTPLKFASPLHQYARTASMRAVFSHKQRVCLYFCNQFNSILAKVIDNSTGSIVYWQTNQSSW